jgi:hypothetical protein
MSCDTVAFQVAVKIFEGVFENKTTRKIFGPKKENSKELENVGNE